MNAIVGIVCLSVMALSASLATVRADETGAAARENAAMPVGNPIQGRLVLPSSVPVRGFPVILRGQQGQDTIAFTDDNGVFVAHALPPGEYTIIPANRWGPERKAVVPESKRGRWAWLFGRGDPAPPADVGVIEIVPPQLATTHPGAAVMLAPQYGRPFAANAVENETR